ncbi:MAG: DNA-protecting protein DprA [Pelagimonas sp.]|jgi:predicted Rossmann fold nucleotide-binding protein DprA/Smf involved in DNA uptake|nr:DNA-protecting protein DprA [Pelagimonas sp.]
MKLTPNTQATLLLTSYLGKATGDTVKPLTNSEWGRFAFWLKDKGLTPAQVLHDGEACLAGWHDRTINVERIVGLLKRGHALALAVEKWQRAGLWIMTRADEDYPSSLKSKLGINSPPVLFGCGNRNLLNTGGLAVVGSRSAEEADLQFTEQIGAKAALNHVAIVSGAARGVDEAAMIGAMQSGGTVVGVVADSLMRKATSSKWRKGLMDGRIALVTPFHPEAGFNAGNAMSRNKYIYCLAESALVIHSGAKGGTLNGAQENLKNGWVPLWVKPTLDEGAANRMLVSMGGRWIEDTVASVEISSLIPEDWEKTKGNSKLQSDMFSDPALYNTDAAASGQNASDISTAAASAVDADNSKFVETDQVPVSADFYSIFVKQLAIRAAEPVTADDIATECALQKGQVSVWLKQAVKDGWVTKLQKPVRYQYIGNPG